MLKKSEPPSGPNPRVTAGWRPRRLLPVSGAVVQTADLVILGAVYLAVVLLPRFHRSRQTLAEFLQLSISLRVVLVAGLCLLTWRTILVTVGMYAPQRLRSWMDYLLRCLIGLNSCTLVVALMEVVLHAQGNLWRISELFWVISLAAMALVRVVLLAASRRLRPRMRTSRNILLVGSGQRARDLYAELEAEAEGDLRLLGYVDSEPQGVLPPGLLLGTLDDLEPLLRRLEVDEVVIALPMKSQYEAVGYAIAVCQMLGIRSRYMSDR